MPTRVTAGKCLEALRWDLCCSLVSLCGFLLQAQRSAQALQEAAGANEAQHVLWDLLESTVMQGHASVWVFLGLTRLIRDKGLCLVSLERRSKEKGLRKELTVLSL